ncbi:feather keratin 1-like [Agelaius tricolor]
MSLLENYCPHAVTGGLGQHRSSIKAVPSPHCLIHSSPVSLRTRLLLTCAFLPPFPLSQVHLQPQAMSCYTRCQPCQPCGPTPLGSSCNEPCVRQCQDSTVAIQPSPVVVTLPGPILSSFPQNTAVGSSSSAAVGSILSSQGVPISSGGFGLSGLGSGLCGRRCFPC